MTCFVSKKFISEKKNLLFAYLPQLLCWRFKQILESFCQLFCVQCIELFLKMNTHFT